MIARINLESPCCYKWWNEAPLTVTISNVQTYVDQIISLPNAIPIFQMNVISPSSQ